MKLVYKSDPIEAFEGLFHVTAHGVGDERIFRDNEDKGEFLACLRNHLDPHGCHNSSRHKYEYLGAEVSLITYAVIDNHYHLVMRELVPGGLRRLMRRVQIRYAMYFNRKYKRRGPVFDRRFEPTPIADLRHALNAIAYVHLNHVVEQLDYEYTGHLAMLGVAPRAWIDSPTGLQLFGGEAGYKRFLNREGPAIVGRKLRVKGMCQRTYRYRPIA